MANIFRKFKEHPAEVGMSYGQHLRFALKLARYNFKAAFASVIHAFLPFFLKKTTSSTISKQYVILKDRIPENCREKDN
jgi:hypothetical protein